MTACAAQVQAWSLLNNFGIGTFWTTTATSTKDDSIQDSRPQLHRWSPFSIVSPSFLTREPQPLAPHKKALGSFNFKTRVPTSNAKDFIKDYLDSQIPLADMPLPRNLKACCNQVVVLQTPCQLRRPSCLRDLRRDRSCLLAGIDDAETFVDWSCGEEGALAIPLEVCQVLWNSYVETRCFGLHVPHLASTTHSHIMPKCATCNCYNPPGLTFATWLATLMMSSSPPEAMTPTALAFHCTQEIFWWWPGKFTQKTTVLSYNAWSFAHPERGLARSTAARLIDAVGHPASATTSLSNPRLSWEEGLSCGASSKSVIPGLSEFELRRASAKHPCPNRDNVLFPAAHRTAPDVIST